MAQINLLPWREELRAERQRQFIFVASGSAIFTALIVFYIHLHFNGLITQQNSRNNFVESSIAEVEQDIKEIETLEKDKQSLLSRMKIIQELQSSRPEIVHLFYEVAHTLPDGVYITKLKRDADRIKIEGVAESNANVSSFMRNLDASEWLSNPSLGEIKTNSKQYEGLSWFNVNVSQLHTSKEKVKK